VPCLFELPTALLEYLDLLQGCCSPPAFRVATPIWLWLWNIQYSGTALLLLVNPFILHQNNYIVCPTYVFIVWKEDALLPTHYAAVRINNCLKRTFVIKVATMKITDELMEAITCLPLNWQFSWWTKMNGTQRRAVLSPQRTHCMYSSMAKGTSRGEVTSNSKKIRPIALAIVELRESEGIRQALTSNNIVIWFQNWSFLFYTIKCLNRRHTICTRSPETSWYNFVRLCKSFWYCSSPMIPNKVTILWH